MTDVRLHIDPGQLADVNRLLLGMPGAIRKVIQQSVNRTLSGVRTDATDEVYQVITATKTAIRKTMTVKNMTSADGSAYVRCAGGPLNLVEFSARQTQKGVTVQVLRQGSRTLLRHAFISAMKSGKRLALWRKWDGVRRPWKKTFPYGKLPASYRLPVKGLMSMAIPQVMGYPPTMDKILELGGDRLQENLEDRLQYELSKING